MELPERALSSPTAPCALMEIQSHDGLILFTLQTATSPPESSSGVPVVGLQCAAH
jgi:hypothetical protein